MKNDQEIAQIYEILLKQVIENSKPKEAKHPNIWSKLAPNISSRIILAIALVSFIFVCVSALINSTIILKAMLTIFIILLFLFLLLYLIKELRSLKGIQKQIETNFKKIINQAETNDWSIVDQLIKAANFKKDILEVVKVKISSSIEEIKDRTEITYKFIKILSIFIIAIIIYGWIPSDLLLKIINSTDIKLWTGILALLSALLTGIVLVWELHFALDFQVEINKLKKCLYLLEQAKLLIDNVGFNKDIMPIKQRANKQSLMSQLKNIKIDGPEDFAENIDLYLSGEKRIETDIR